MKSYSVIKKRYLFLINISIIFSGILFPYYISALAFNYPNLPGAPSPQDLPSFIVYFFYFAIYSGGILVLLLLVISGLRYLLSFGNPETILSAKEQASSAFLGLLLLLSSYLILKTISPSLIGLEEPQKTIKETPSLEKISEEEKPPTAELTSLIVTEIPLGRIIQDRIFQRFLSEEEKENKCEEGYYPVDPEDPESECTANPSYPLSELESIKKQARMTRIQTIAENILKMANDIKDYSKELKDAAEECECESVIPICKTEGESFEEESSEEESSETESSESLKNKSPEEQYYSYFPNKDRTKNSFSLFSKKENQSLFSSLFSSLKTSSFLLSQNIIEPPPPVVLYPLTVRLDISSGDQTEKQGVFDLEANVYYAEQNQDITYYFYCNTKTDLIIIDEAIAGKPDKVITTKNTKQKYTCEYDKPGLHKAKVIVKQGNNKAQEIKDIRFVKIDVDIEEMEDYYDSFNKPHPRYKINIKTQGASGKDLRYNVKCDKGENRNMHPWFENENPGGPIPGFVFPGQHEYGRINFFEFYTNKENLTAYCIYDQSKKYEISVKVTPADEWMRETCCSTKIKKEIDISAMFVSLSIDHYYLPHFDPGTYTLRADVWNGPSDATLAYYFYCNNPNPDINLNDPADKIIKKEGPPPNNWFASYDCGYDDNGTYFAKVIVVNEETGEATQDRKTISHYLEPRKDFEVRLASDDYYEYTNSKIKLTALAYYDGLKKPLANLPSIPRNTYYISEQEKESLDYLLYCKGKKNNPKPDQKIEGTTETKVKLECEYDEPGSYLPEIEVKMGNKTAKATTPRPIEIIKEDKSFLNVELKNENLIIKGKAKGLIKFTYYYPESGRSSETYYNVSPQKEKKEKIIIPFFSSSDERVTIIERQGYKAMLKEYKKLYNLSLRSSDPSRFFDFFFRTEPQEDILDLTIGGETENSSLSSKISSSINAQFYGIYLGEKIINRIKETNLKYEFFCDNNENTQSIIENIKNPKKEYTCEYTEKDAGLLYPYIKYILKENDDILIQGKKETRIRIYDKNEIFPFNRSDPVFYLLWNYFYAWEQAGYNENPLEYFQSCYNNESCSVFRYLTYNCHLPPADNPHHWEKCKDIQDLDREDFWKYKLSGAIECVASRYGYDVNSLWSYFKEKGTNLDYEINLPNKEDLIMHYSLPCDAPWGVTPPFGPCENNPSKCDDRISYLDWYFNYKKLPTNEFKEKQELYRFLIDDYIYSHIRAPLLKAEPLEKEAPFTAVLTFKNNSNFAQKYDEIIQKYPNLNFDPKKKIQEIFSDKKIYFDIYFYCDNDPDPHYLSNFPSSVSYVSPLTPAEEVIFKSDFKFTEIPMEDLENKEFRVECHYSKPGIYSPKVAVRLNPSPEIMNDFDSSIEQGILHGYPSVYYDSIKILAYEPPSYYGECHCDPCKKVRDDIQDNQNKIIKTIFGKENKDENNENNYENNENEEENENQNQNQSKEETEDNLRKEQRKLLQEITGLKKEINKLNQAVALMSSCGLDNLQSLANYLAKKDKYIAKGWSSEIVNFWEDIKVKEDWASFYCPTSGTIWEEKKPLGSPSSFLSKSLANLLSQSNSSLDNNSSKEEKETSAPVSPAYSCTTEIPVGEIIDRAKRIGNKLVERMEKLNELTESLIKAVDELLVLISKCTSQNCAPVCSYATETETENENSSPGSSSQSSSESSPENYSENSEKKNYCIGEPCPLEEIKDKYQEIVDIIEGIKEEPAPSYCPSLKSKEGIKDVVEGKRKTGKEKEDDKCREQIGIKSLIEEIIPSLNKDVELLLRDRLKLATPNLGGILLKCERVKNEIGPDNRLIKYCCYDQPYYKICLARCAYEKGFDKEKNKNEYKRCLYQCFKNMEKIYNIPEISSCHHKWNFFSCVPK